MSFNNPYEDRGAGGGGGGGNGGGFQNRPAGGGGGFQRGGGKGGFQQREPLTPEQLSRLRLPSTVVITGNDRIPDGDAMTIDVFVKMIEAKGITIRCGGSSETDKVVIKSARYVEYHLPFKNFDDIEVKGLGSTFNTDECFEFAKRYYQGDFETANKFQRANHGKTARLLFGKSLRSPTQLVIVWTGDTAENAAQTNSRSGIAGHVIRMASAAGIPIINVNSSNAEERLKNFLENISVKQQPVQKQATATNGQGNGNGGYNGGQGNGSGGYSTGGNGGNNNGGYNQGGNSNTGFGDEDITY